MMPGISLNCRRTSTTTEPGRPADRSHAERAEEIGQEPADDEADDTTGILQVEVDRERSEMMMPILGVCPEQDE